METQKQPRPPKKTQPEETPAENAKKKGFFRRLLTGALWLTVPVGEIRLMGRVIRDQTHATVKRTKQYLPDLTPEKGDNTADETSWAEAVAHSGLPPERLARNFRWQRGVCRGIFWCSCLLLLGSLVLLVRGAPVQMVSLTLVMLAGALAALTRALTAGYRLWQLTTHRVSLSEKGTFRHYLAERNWLHEALGIRITKKARQMKKKAD